MATMNEDGYILIVDRKKDIIVSGGENISSLEVEKKLLAHPAVYELAVIPVPDEKWGEVPKALVVLKPGRKRTKRSSSNSAAPGWRTTNARGRLSSAKVCRRQARGKS